MVANPGLSDLFVLIGNLAYLVTQEDIVPKNLSSATFIIRAIQKTVSPIHILQSPLSYLHLKQSFPNQDTAGVYHRDWLDAHLFVKMPGRWRLWHMQMRGKGLEPQNRSCSAGLIELEPGFPL